MVVHGFQKLHLGIDSRKDLIVEVELAIIVPR
jgi:hypothetical protein